MSRVSPQVPGERVTRKFKEYLMQKLLLWDSYISTTHLRLWIGCISATCMNATFSSSH